jgi:hypothetical protein
MFGADKMTIKPSEVLDALREALRSYMLWPYMNPDFPNLTLKKQRDHAFKAMKESKDLLDHIRALETVAEAVAVLGRGKGSEHGYWATDVSGHLRLFDLVAALEVRE